jgi:hypothetical protein
MKIRAVRLIVPRGTKQTGWRLARFIASVQADSHILFHMEHQNRKGRLFFFAWKSQASRQLLGFSFVAEWETVGDLRELKYRPDSVEAPLADALGLHSWRRNGKFIIANRLDLLDLTFGMGESFPSLFVPPWCFGGAQAETEPPRPSNAVHFAEKL